MTITFSHAESLMRRSRSGRWRLGNNTYLYPRGPNAFAVRYHYTDVVTIHRDGTFTLAANGWYTPTTKDRINGYSPARVYSEGGTWCVWHRASDPKTPPQVRTCRACRGTGTKHTKAHVRVVGQAVRHERGEHWQLPEPVVHPSEPYACSRCDGTGQCDYGSKPMPVIFADGIRVDGDGKVVRERGMHRDRLNDPRVAERQAREEWRAERERKRAQKAAGKQRAAELAANRAGRIAWLEGLGLTVTGSEAVMFKGVHDDLRSWHGTAYVPGTTVTAEDYEPVLSCGAGLHFSPSPRATLDYDPDATRFLACAVDLATLLTLDDKAKAKSCRVLYEVDIEGEPLTPGRRTELSGQSETGD